MLKTKEEIEKWLIRYRVIGYKINEDLSIDVNGDVYLNNKKLYKLPVKFNIINGSFDCSSSGLISLKGCPEIVNGYFDCYRNNIETLSFFPKKNMWSCGSARK